MFCRVTSPAGARAASARHPRAAAIPTDRLPPSISGTTGRSSPPAAFRRLGPTPATATPKRLARLTQSPCHLLSISGGCEARDAPERLLAQPVFRTRPISPAERPQHQDPAASSPRPAENDPAPISGTAGGRRPERDLRPSTAAGHGQRPRADRARPLTIELSHDLLASSRHHAHLTEAIANSTSTDGRAGRECPPSADRDPRRASRAISGTAGMLAAKRRAERVDAHHQPQTPAHPSRDQTPHVLSFVDRSHDHTDHRPVANTYTAMSPLVVAWASTASPSARR